MATRIADRRAFAACSAPRSASFAAATRSTLGVTSKQLAALVARGVIERVLPDTYRMTAVAPLERAALRAALLWAGDDAAAAGRSAGEVYGLEGRTRRGARDRRSRTASRAHDGAT